MGEMNTGTIGRPPQMEDMARGETPCVVEAEETSRCHMESNDELKWILERATESVRNIDSKNGVLIAILAAIAAILFSGEAFLSAVSDQACPEWAYRVKAVCIALMVGAALVSAIALTLSLIPRAQCPKDSLIYSGQIARFENAGEYAKALDKNTIDFQGDLVNQIYITSTIYRRKTFWNKVATIAMAALVILIVAFACICVIGA